MNEKIDELEELNFKEKEYFNNKLPQFEKEKAAFMQENANKEEYFQKLQKKCQNIEKNNVILVEKLDKLKLEINQKKEELLKEEEDLKSEFEKIKEYL
jgi:ACT domain-containing protein